MLTFAATLATLMMPPSTQAQYPHSQLRKHKMKQLLQQLYPKTADQEKDKDGKVPKYSKEIRWLAPHILRLADLARAFALRDNAAKSKQMLNPANLGCLMDTHCIQQSIMKVADKNPDIYNRGSADDRSLRHATAIDIVCEATIQLIQAGAKRAPLEHDFEDMVYMPLWIAANVAQENKADKFKCLVRSFDFVLVDEVREIMNLKRFP